MSALQSLPQIVTAIGGLGTAAFGLVDSTKVLFGGVNRIGFKGISKAVTGLTPGAASAGLTQSQIISTLKANWYNGTDLASQKSIAKSLIKQGLNPGNAGKLAAVTGVDGTVLQTVATKIVSGAPLQPGESDVYARFDFILTALLDEVYQRSDQAFTNGTRVVASFFAVALALVAGLALHTGNDSYLWSHDMGVAFIAGLLATPLAPIAKDVSSAIATAVNTMQVIRK